MQENQNLEWKESWHDEYLKWICGFANAEGGVLLIGRNDKGVDVGVANAKKLLSNHASCPYNPLVANAFFRAGEIEAWGRGIKRIVEACREAGSPAPIITYEPHDLWMEFPYSPDYLSKISKGNASGMEGGRDEASGKTPWPESWPESWPRTMANKIFSLLYFGEKSKSELSERVGVTTGANSLKKALRQLLDEKLIVYTLPDKPTSRLQKYRLTPKGKEVLDALQKETP